MPKFYLTTPLYYVNAPPHLGHAYSTLVADTIRRYKKMQGYEAFLLTGTDEHGQKVERSARAAGLSPQQFTDQVSALFREQWQDLGVEFDSFIRTTEARHAAAVRKIFAAVWKAGYIYKGHYTGQYCVFDELYASEAGPGDPCPECGRPTETVTEENYFFKLSAFQDRLLAYYEEHPELIRPETRRNEVIAFVRSGLRDLSISRTTLKWGIPLPRLEAQREEGTEPAASALQHVFYVWFDALTGYLSGIGYGQGGAEEERFRRLWPVDLHLVGKEILRFHAVYWPAFLMAAGLPVPRAIFAHGWLLFEEDKMSKSRGNIVQPQPVREVLGTDALRYFLLREIPFGQDGNFSFDALVSRYNSDLANDYGNLASRVLTMITRYFQREIPYPSALAQRADRDRQILETADRVIARYAACFDRLEFSSGLEAVWELIGAVNKYLVETEPWALAEQETSDDRSRLATILFTAAEALRIATALLAPVMPDATGRIWRQLGLSSDLSCLSFETMKTSLLPTGEKIGKVEPVFPRLPKEETVQKLLRLQEGESKKSLPAKEGPPAVSGQPPSTERISIEDFLKLDMRVGEVRVAERVKGASKLLRLEVDIGTEIRQVVAGIAETYAPESLVGKKVVIVANLEPRKLRGIESNGMIVAASVGKEDRPVLVTFTEDVPNGARLR